MMRFGLLLMVAGALAMTGCVQNSDVKADAALRRQAITAFATGDHARARAIVAEADKLYVPSAQLWRRTLELRMAIEENARHGELRRFLVAWGEQREDWNIEDVAEAQLALAQTLTPDYAADWLYDIDTATWPRAQRTRYNLLRAGLQQGKTALHDDTVARWRLGVRGLYDSGRLLAAANEAARCANETHNAEAALLAAKLYNEAGNAKRKGQSLALAEALAAQNPTLMKEIGMVRTAPLGEKSAF